MWGSTNFLLYLSVVVNLAYGYWLKGNFFAALNCLVCAVFTINSDYTVLIVLNVTRSYILALLYLTKSCALRFIVRLNASHSEIHCLFQYAFCVLHNWKTIHILLLHFVNVGEQCHHHSTLQNKLGLLFVSLAMSNCDGMH